MDLQLEEKLKNQTNEPEEVIETDSKELTEEEKKQQEEFFKGFLKYQIRGYIPTIKQYIDTNEITIQQAIDEAINKKSRLSRAARDILTSIKPEILEEWFLKNPRIQNGD